MKIFAAILLTSFAYTTADVSSLIQSGYNYQAQTQPLIMQSLTGAVQQQQAQQQQYEAPISQPSNQHQPQRSQSAALPASFPMPASFSAGPVSALAPRRRRPRVKIPKKPIVTKSFYIHSAPEESDDDIQDELRQFSQQSHKHYNVLFVKTPSQTSKAAALNLAKAVKEEKTVVYVLSKKTTAADLQDAIVEAPQQIHKPEVFFIKYRTDEEAAHAQRQIQTQFDSLGGTSTITDEGLAPVTSVVGSLDAPEEEEIDEQQQFGQTDEQLVNSIGGVSINSGIGGGVSDGSNQYLPPSQY